MLIWIGIILAILLLILFLPISVLVDISNEGQKVDVKIFGLKFKILPKKEKKKKPKKVKESKGKSKEKQTKKQDSNNFVDTIKLVAKILPPALDGFMFFAKRLKFKKFKVSIEYGDDDPATTAVRYGQIGSAVYSSLGIICSLLDICDPEIEITPNFQKQVFIYSITCKVSSSLGIILLTAVNKLPNIIKLIGK